MEVKQGKLSVEDILDINSGIAEIATMNIDAIMMMDLGMIKAGCETVLTSYQDAINKFRLSEIDKLKKYTDKDGKESISVLDSQKLNDIVNTKDAELRAKKYDISYPELTRDELTSMINKDKESDDEKAFKPSIAFFKFMSKFIK